MLMLCTRLGLGLAFVLAFGCQHAVIASAPSGDRCTADRVFVAPLSDAIEAGCYLECGTGSLCPIGLVCNDVAAGCCAGTAEDTCECDEQAMRVCVDPG